MGTPDAQSIPAAPPGPESGRLSFSAADSRVTLRSVLLGILVQAAVFAWVADSEIRQSVYLICYSLMMPAVVALAGMLALNVLLRQFAPRAVLTPREMAVVYIMLTCSLPIAGFGGLRFVLPTLGLAFYRTTAENWTRFGAYLPDWIAPHGAGVWRGFFRGESAVPWEAWLLPLLFWCMFLLALAGAWLCLSLLLRRRWIEAERLTFPIVYLPLQLTAAPRLFFASPLMWLGFAIPCALQSLLALNYLYPSVPAMQLKAWDAGFLFTARPWNAIGYLPVGLYPTAIGLAFFIPTDISFSCWFFYLLVKLLNVAGAAAGFDMAGQGQAATRFPYPQEQAAGAWIALGAMAVWALKGRQGDNGLRFGLLACLAAAWGMGTLAGVPPVAGLLMLGVYGLYVVCGARIRAEVGAQWTFAPLVWTPAQVTLHALGPAGMGDRALVVTSLFESVNVDVRGQAMPNQMESFKIADSLALDRRQVTRLIMLATVLGVALAAFTSLRAWYDAGAATAKANAYALTKSQIVWQTLSRHYDNPMPRDLEGMTAAGSGAAATFWLAWMRLRSPAWPFHPLGYVLANTLTVNAFWIPFFLAWLCKTLVRRYGGIRIYRKAVIFFLGMVLGDILTQSFWTLAGRLLGFPVYQFLT
jgi:hypothetical protein